MVCRAIVLDLQPHGVALAAVVQFVFHRLEQIAAVLLVDVKLAVARDAEMPVAEDLRAGKQVAPDNGRSARPEKHNPAASSVARQLDQPAAARAAPAPRPGAAAFRRPVFISNCTMMLSDLLSNCGNGCAGSMRQRRQHRAHLRAVKFLHPLPVRLAQARRSRESGCRVRPAPGASCFAPAGVLLVAPCAGRAAWTARNVSAGGQAVQAALDDRAFHLLLQAGHADLEKLVQIGAGDAEELQPFQQRDWPGPAPPPARAG